MTAAALAAALVAYAVVVEPLWGLWYLRRLRAGVVDERVRVRLYRVTIATEWTYTLCALLAFALSGLPAREVFLAPPRLTGVGPLADPAVLAGMAVGLVGGAIAAVVAARRAGGGADATGGWPQVVGDIDVLVPRTPRERRWYAVLAITAGICEEALYRGVVLVSAALLFPAAPLWVLAMGVAVAFGVAHLYQGAAGVAVTTALGALLGLLVVATGSLLPAMLLHALIDLRVLLLPVPAPARAG